MISKQLKKEHIFQAVNEVSSTGIPNSRKSTKYDLIVNGVKYPPKYVISIAHRYLINRELRPDEFDAVQAKQFLIDNGFKVERKKSNELVEIQPNEKFEIFNDEYIENSDIFEGALKQVEVNIYERSSRARKLCLEHHGYHCKVCDFDFEKTYGEIGKEFIHVHHVVDLATVGKEYKVDPINDLVPVCPNCHAMLHKKKPIAFTIEELKEHLNEQI